MAAPSGDPIEVQIRDGIATVMGANMTQANGYYFDIGTLNEFDISQVTTWPTAQIVIDEEINVDDEGDRPANHYYTNRLFFQIKYLYKNNGAVGSVDRVKEAAKLAHDIKKLFGDYDLLSAYGAYETRPIGYRRLNSGDETLPAGVDMRVEVHYHQSRTTPSEG